MYGIKICYNPEKTNDECSYLSICIYQILDCK